MNLLAKKYKDKGLKIVAINCDSADELEKVKKMQEDNKYEFDILLDPEMETPTKYESTGFPESFFISKDGKFLDFDDPETKKTTRRIISERDWNSNEIAKSVEKLL